MAHKLTEKVLHPKMIEKSNAKLADSLFRESTMNVLMYYAGNGYPQFEDSAIFIKYIRDGSIKLISKVLTTEFVQGMRDRNH